jgi:hypothetical protein
MLSFDISAIDVVLMVVMLVLLLLFVTRRKSQSVAEPRLRIRPQDEPSEEPEVREKPPVDSCLDKQPVDGFRECVHQFGHLRGMPKNTAVPAECFGCPKVLRCMFKNE